MIALCLCNNMTLSLMEAPSEKLCPLDGGNRSALRPLPHSEEIINITEFCLQQWIVFLFRCSDSCYSERATTSCQDFDLFWQLFLLNADSVEFLKSPYGMKFSRHACFAILSCAFFATLKFGDFAKICISNHFNFAFSSNTQFIYFAMLLKHDLEFTKSTSAISKLTKTPRR